MTPPLAEQPKQPPPPRRLRVLCLHSWRTSAAIFRDQWRRAGLDRALGDLVDLVFIDAPNPASGPIPDDVAGLWPHGPYHEWFSTEKAKRGEELIFTYRNMLESERFIMRMIIQLGPFDGICGFSQGGAMASIMAALQSAGLALSDAPPLRFCLFFGAVLTTHPRYAPAFSGRVPVPSLHLVGHRDYVKEHAIALAGAFEAPVVVMHTRGHVVPPLAHEQLAVVRAFLRAVRDGDGSGGGGDGGGGAATERLLARWRDARARRAAAAGGPPEPLAAPDPAWEQRQQAGGDLDVRGAAAGAGSSGERQQQQQQQATPAQAREEIEATPANGGGVAAGDGGGGGGGGGRQPPYTQVVVLSGGRIPKLVPKL